MEVKTMRVCRTADKVEMVINASDFDAETMSEVEEKAEAQDPVTTPVEKSAGGGSGRGDVVPPKKRTTKGS